MNSSDKRPFYKKTDIIIIAVILVVCMAAVVIQYYGKSKYEGAFAAIYQNGSLIKTAELNDDGVFSAGGAEFEIKDHMIRFKDSDCPDKLCVNVGFIGKANDIAVCLPKKMYIKIVGQASESHPADIIAG